MRFFAIAIVVSLLVLAPVGLAQQTQQQVSVGQLVVNEKDQPPEVLAKIKAVQKAREEVSAIPAEAKKLKDEVLERIDALAKKLGVTIEHLWGVLVRQAYVEAGFAIVWLVLGVGLLVGSARCISAYYRTRERWTDEMIFKTVVLAILSFLFFVVACIEVGDVGYLFNPEYFALEKVKAIFSGGTH